MARHAHWAHARRGVRRWRHDRAPALPALLSIAAVVGNAVVDHGPKALAAPAR
jgi:hypothetical protein